MSEPFSTTMHWLVSQNGVEKSTSSSRSGVMVKPETPTSAVPLCHQGGDDGVELHGGQIIALKAELVGDGLHQVDLETFDIAVVEVLERREVERCGHGELAVLDEGVAAVGGRLGGVGRPASGTGGE